MAIVMGCDPAGNFGYAFYDLDRPPSAIESGSLKLEGDILDKIYQLRQQMPSLIKRYAPMFAVVESPFKFAPQYKRAPKRDLITGIAEEIGEGQTTINPSTISHAGQIAGAATMCLLAWNVQVQQVQPKEWQSAVIPKSIYQQFAGKGMAKKRAEATCNMLRIVSPNVDARDAALMAMFAAAHPRLKMMQMRGAA